MSMSYVQTLTDIESFRGLLKPSLRIEFYKMNVKYCISAWQYCT